MRITRFTTWAAVIACTLFLAAPAHALTLNDPGVVGTIETDVDSNQATNVANEVEWANFLLALAANQNVTVDGNTPVDGDREHYVTSSTNYTGTLSGGTQIQNTGGTTNVGSYAYVLAKYDGQNAGYVLFNVAALGGTNIPEFSFSVWGSNAGQYQLSHFTGFGTTVPDGGATLSLLGLALAGIGAVRRYMSA